MVVQAADLAGDTGPLVETAVLNLANHDLDDVSILVQETPELENLNLAFNHLDRVTPLQKLSCLMRLNLSHNQILDVERIGQLQDLEVLNLSKNKLTNLGSICDLMNLEELWLRDNDFRDLQSIQNLGACSNLKKLVLKPNPVCRDLPEIYFKLLVHNVPSLEILDGRAITSEERDAAAAFWLSHEGRKVLKDAGLEGTRNARPHVQEGGGERGAWGYLPMGAEAPTKQRKTKPREAKPGGGKGSDGHQSRKKPTETSLRELAGMPEEPRRRRGGIEEGREHVEVYGKKGPAALILRQEGLSEARYANGSVAISMDDLRITAMFRNGDVAVTCDAEGNAMVCLPSGFVVYNHSNDNGGRLMDLVTGQLVCEWSSDGQMKGDGGGGEGREKFLLQCKLNDHLGVRINRPGGEVEVFFVTDGGGSGTSSSSSSRRDKRIKHLFRPRRARKAAAEWDASGPFGDGEAPRPARGPSVPSITTDEYLYEIKAATDKIIDFEKLKSNLGSGGEEVELQFRGKIGGNGSGPMLPAGGAARRRAYAEHVRSNFGLGGTRSSERSSPRTSRKNSWEVKLDDSSVFEQTGLGYGDPKLTRRRESEGKQPEAAPSPIESQVSALAANAREALRKLSQGMEEHIVEESKKSPGSNAGRVPAKRSSGEARRGGGAAGTGTGAGAGSGTRAGTRAGTGAGAPKFKSNSSVVAAPAALAHARAQPRGSKEGDGGGRGKSAVTVEAEPDLPQEELDRLKAIREQMRNMMNNLSMAPQYS
uniref:U2A'/phosphoprotein 32 family A C-terminal domain-containing protein n=1 Tax=Guillardia theta TaxID=55529 RepID=A0A7S4KMC5_GUITH|mmetsp:Transcript_27286/g.89083  ORF Transcript_27286/g.89083 Transcript_27286/m.89083 type:complete len:763 (+) Transcript_27286:88-2376(+)